MSQALNSIDETVAHEDTVFLAQPPEELVFLEYLPGESQLDWICYEKHPAYAGFIQSSNFYQKLSSLAVFAKYFVFIVIKRIISYEQISADVRKPKSLKDAINFFREAFRSLPFFISNKAKFLSNQADMQVNHQLNKHGVAVVNTDHQAFERVVGLAEPVFKQLRDRRGQQISGNRDFSESRTTALRTDHAELFAAVESLFIKNGIMGAVSGYLGRSARIVDINPQINDSSDDFWLRFFPDLTMDKPITAYYHRDASGGDVKAIIYLNDVRPENGPFSFVLGSHKIKVDWLSNLIQETNDSSGLSSTEPNARERFAALPAIFRKKCAFGNDVLSESDVAERIHAAAWQITAARGHVVVFDSKGVHRGGMVAEGERIVITCVLG